MTVEEARDAIQGVLEQLLQSAGVQIILREEPRIQTPTDIKDKLMLPNGGAISYAVVRRIRSLTRVGREYQVPMGFVNVYHTFQVSLYYAYQEGASETAFQQLIDAILDAGLPLRSMGVFSNTAPLSLDRIDEEWLRMFLYTHKAFFSVEAISLHETTPS